MFPDTTQRLTAVRLCFNSTATTVTVDPTPAVRRACYFDYKVTNNEQAGRDANTGMEDYQNEKASVGKPHSVLFPRSNVVFFKLYLLCFTLLS